MHRPETAEKPHPAGRESLENAHHLRAEAIARMGIYPGKALEMLQQEGLLEEEEKRVSKEYDLDGINLKNETVRAIFTLEDLYDPGTARHSRETYRIAQMKMDKIIAGTSFRRLSKNEGVSEDEFENGCIGHDFGKILLPLSILHETDRKKYRSPAREVLSPEDLTRVQGLGFTGDETLMEIMKEHERFSGEILEKAGLFVEAYIAAHHHNYGNKKLEKYSATIGALHISVLEDMLHLADIEQALLSADRPYKKAFTVPEMMVIIVDETKKNEDLLFAAYLWLTDDLAEYEGHLLASGETPSEEDNANLEIVKKFLTDAKESVEVIDGLKS